MLLEKKKFKKQLQFIIDHLRNKEVDQNPSAKYYKNIQKKDKKKTFKNLSKGIKNFPRQKKNKKLQYTRIRCKTFLHMKGKALFSIEKTIMKFIKF